MERGRSLCEKQDYIPVLNILAWMSMVHHEEQNRRPSKLLKNIEKSSRERFGSRTTSTESPELDFAYKRLGKAIIAISRDHNESMVKMSGQVQLAHVKSFPFWRCCPKASRPNNTQTPVYDAFLAYKSCQVECMFDTRPRAQICGFQ
jgi:RNase P/RNase MRP subunit POP5